MEEDRVEHFHVLGKPNQGKSKFLEMMMSLDIKYLMDEKIPFDSGFCFLDSTGNGGTAKKVMKYALTQGFEKIIYIDPHLIWEKDYGYVVNINPIDYDAPGEAVATHLLESLRILWSTKDPADEAYITNYAPKVFRVLHSAHVTLPDSLALVNPYLTTQRDFLLSQEKDFNTRTTLQHAISGSVRDTSAWRGYQSTCRRLGPFYTDTLRLMFGAIDGIDFQKLLREGWCIIVNLYKGGVFAEEHARLLGTIILTEIVKAKERMENYTVPYYIYIDEAQRYATKLIPEFLDHYRHFDLRLTLSHQGFSQIDDPKVLNAIRRSANNKVMFHSSRPDIDVMVKDMNYGGELPLEQVAYAHGALPKQEAVCRIGKNPPVLTRMKDWPDADVSDKELKSFIQYLYKTNPDLYRPKDDVDGEIKNRFATIRSASGSRANTGGARNTKTKEAGVYVKPETGSSDKIPKSGAKNDSEPAGTAVPVQQERRVEEGYLAKKRKALADKTRKLPRHGSTSPKDGEGQDNKGS